MNTEKNRIDEERRLRAREEVRCMAKKSLRAGTPTAWFEEVYAHARGDVSRVPWANLAPHPLLVRLLDHVAPQPGKRALVVGAGLGDDAALCARRGLDVQAFDLSLSAVSWARERQPALADRFSVRDLFALPAEWDGAFDLVVEVYTLQALPAELRAQAFAHMARTLGPEGVLLAVARQLPPGTPLDEARDGPPWPLARAEFQSWGESSGLVIEHVELAAAADKQSGFQKQGLVLRR